MVLRSAFGPTIRGRDAELGVVGRAARSGALGFGCGSADRGRGRHGEEPPDRRGRDDGATACPSRSGSARLSLRNRWPSLRLCSGRSSTDPTRCWIAPGLSSLRSGTRAALLAAAEICSLCSSARRWTAHSSYSWTTCSGPTAAPSPRCARCHRVWPRASDRVGARDAPRSGRRSSSEAPSSISPTRVQKRLVLEPLSDAAVAQIATRRHAGRAR